MQTETPLHEAVGTETKRTPQEAMCPCMSGEAEHGVSQCPMGSMCKGMMENAGAGWGALLLLPGMVLAGIGVLLFVWPQILVWLIAGVAILLGSTMTLFSIWIWRFLARSKQGVEQEPEGGRS